MHSEFKLKLKYKPNSSQQYKESITYCVLLDLLLEHNMRCTQSSASMLVFESDRDRTLASIVLSSAKEYTVVCVD